MYSAKEIEEEFNDLYEKVGIDTTKLNPLLNKLQKQSNDLEFAEFVLKNSKTIKRIWSGGTSMPNWLNRTYQYLADNFRNADIHPELLVLFFEQDSIEVEDIFKGKYGYNDLFKTDVYNSISRIKNKNLQFEIITKIRFPEVYVKGIGTIYAELPNLRSIYEIYNLELPKTFVYKVPTVYEDIPDHTVKIIEIFCKKYRYEPMRYKVNYDTNNLEKSMYAQNLFNKVWIEGSVFGYTFEVLSKPECQLGTISRCNNTVKFVYITDAGYKKPGRPIEEYSINLKTGKINKKKF